MNEPFFPFRRSIELAAEPAFALGKIHVSPATLELGWDGHKETIEPRVMQVLVALHRHMPESVSRDDLSQLCWGGRIVGEDALNRSISRLRKALAAEPHAIVDTIPKVGYRLRLEPDATDNQPVPAASESPPSRKSRLRVGIFAATLGAAALATALLWTGGDPTWSADAVRPLARETASEAAPALSPDGRFLAYTSGDGTGAPRDLYLRGLAVGDSAPIRLTATGEDELSPAWSPDGLRLAFVRRIAGEPCAIVVMSPPRGAERIAGRCRSDVSGISWLDDEALIFSDRLRPGEPRRLFRLDIGSGAVRALTNPAAQLSGDGAPIAAPDGSRVAFRRSVSLGNDDLFVLDLASGKEWPLTSGGFKAYGFAWSADSGTLFFTSNRGGDFGLWSIPVRPGAQPARVSLGLLPFGGLHADRQNRLAAEVSQVRANLAVLNAAGGAAEALTPVTGIDWDPDVAADGRIAYASDAGGTNEIWVKRAGAASTRLTQLRGSYVFSPRWSADGRDIAFIGVKDGKTDIYVMAGDGSRLRTATRDGAAKMSLAWADDGSLLYTRRSGGRWLAARLDGERSVALPGGVDVAILRRAPDGRIYGRDAGDGNIRLLSRDRGPQRLPSAIAVPDSEAWAAARDGLYWAREPGTRNAALWFTAWTGASRRIAALPPAPKTNFAIRPADGAIIAPRLAAEQNDLVLIELSKK